MLHLSSRRLLLGALALVLLSTCRTAPEHVGFKVTKAEFGLIKKDVLGRTIFVPTRQVPLIVGEAYGRLIAIKTKKPTITWREEFELPRAPEIWGSDEGKTVYTLSKDRRLAVTESEVDTATGVIAHSWSVAPGGPTGRYVMRAFIDGRPVATFEFDVQ